jgi:hypothetical protein
MSTKQSSIIQPVRQELGKMSRMLRFAKEMKIRGRLPQAQGMLASANKHWNVAKKQYELMPTSIKKLLSDDELKSLTLGIPLPHSKENRIIRQYIDREVIHYKDNPVLLQREQDANRARQKCEDELNSFRQSTFLQQSKQNREVIRYKDNPVLLQREQDANRARKECEDKLQRCERQQIATLEQYHFIEQQLQKEQKQYEDYVRKCEKETLRLGEQSEHQRTAKNVMKQELDNFQRIVNEQKLVYESQINALQLEREKLQKQYDAVEQRHRLIQQELKEEQKRYKDYVQEYGADTVLTLENLLKSEKEKAKNRLKQQQNDYKTEMNMLEEERNNLAQVLQVAQESLQRVLHDFIPDPEARDEYVQKYIINT